MPVYLHFLSELIFLLSIKSRVISDCAVVLSFCQLGEVQITPLADNDKGLQSQILSFIMSVHNSPNVSFKLYIH